MADFPTIALVSPHTRGKNVEEAQFLLKKNRFNTPFYTGSIDGEYGPITAAATHRAKYWLGYPTKKINGVFGPLLRAYLIHLHAPTSKKLPLSYRLRRALRIKLYKRQQKKKAFRAKALAFAKTFEGYREQPTNRTMFGRWYGLDGNPWCAMFASYCLDHFGSKFKESYVPTIVAKGRANNGCFIVNDPAPGDLVCFDWERNGVYDHVGFFDHWINREAGKFATVEGNTLPPGGTGNQSNGGGVYARERGTRDGYRAVFVRVKES